MEKSEKTIEVLKKAGWYEGRKIDITENIKFLEERGFEVLESAKRFMEEFGELKINVDRERIDGTIKIVEHTTCIKDTVGVLSNINFGLEDFVEEKVMIIGSLHDFNIDLYISESGKFYKSIGWIGDSVWEAFDNIINERGTKVWTKFIRSLF